MADSKEAERTKRRLSRLEVLRQVSCTLVAEKNLDRLLDLIAVETTRVLNAQRSTIYLVVEENGGETHEKKLSLLSKVAQGAGEISLPLGKGSIAGEVAASGSLINLKDAYQDPRFDASWDGVTGFRTVSMLTAPMRTPRGDVVGVVQALNKNTGGGFDSEDEEMLTALCSQAAMAIENSRYLEAQGKVFQSLIRGQAVAIDARDHITSGHTWRVAAYAVEVGRAMGWKEEELRILEYSGLLHDQGKLGIPDEVLLKPGVLSEWEFALMKSHASKTKEILEDVRHLFPMSLRDVPEIASAHHEKLDGSGYPQGLQGAEIAPGAKILAVVDIFDALTARRPYRDPETARGALEFLRREALGGKLDMEVVKALEGIMGKILKLKEGIDNWIRERGMELWDRTWLQEGEMEA